MDEDDNDGKNINRSKCRCADISDTLAVANNKSETDVAQLTISGWVGELGCYPGGVGYRAP